MSPTERLHALRDQVDAVDEMIVTAFSLRTRLVKELWEAKEAAGQQRHDSHREQEILAAYRRHSSRPPALLKYDTAVHLADAVLDLTREELEGSSK